MNEGKMRPSAKIAGWWATWGLPVAVVLCLADLGFIFRMGLGSGLGNVGLALGADAVLSAVIAATLGWTAFALRRENAALIVAQKALNDSLDEQKRILARERELARELDHRVRNNVAGLLGLVSIYERSGKNGQEVAKAIRGKLHAMHEVHNIIARTHGQPVGLMSLIRRLAAELSPADSGGAVRLDGPALDVPAPQAGALAVILHELFTNSQKHGALGYPGGSIDVRWRVAPVDRDRRLELDWQEHSTRSPAPEANGHSSVGLALIKGFAQSDLRGSFEHQMGADGFSCRLNAVIATTPSGTSNGQL